MARSIPFLFARYVWMVNSEPLTYKSQLNFLREIQGQYYYYQSARGTSLEPDTIIMRPRELRTSGQNAIFWSIGRRVGVRVTVEYDEDNDELDFDTVEDQGIHYADIIAIPEHGVLAVDDRASPPRLGGMAALRRLRSVLENISGTMFVADTPTTSQDVARAFKRWKISEFQATIRPANPHSRRGLSTAFSNAIAEERTHKLHIKARTDDARGIAPGDGPVGIAADIVEDGYGQYGLKGITERGHAAQIKKPAFAENKEQNLRKQRESRELRVYVDPSERSQEEVFREISETLRAFYGTQRKT